MLKRLMITLLFLCSFISVKAEEWTNSDTGYRVFIMDDADLLSVEEEEKLLAQLQGLTVYGGAAFVTTDENTTSARKYAESVSYNCFHNDSSVLFLIDMDNRMIWMSTTGEIYKTVTGSYCDTITDNIYQYATDGDYYSCAYNAFDQVKQLMDGNVIAQPMKHVSNLLLALVFSIVMNFLVVMIFSRSMKISKKEFLKGVEKNLTISNVSVNYSHTEKRYDPSSDSSSSGGGGGSGGGFSGGGGGHSF